MRALQKLWRLAWQQDPCPPEPEQHMSGLDRQESSTADTGSGVYVVIIYIIALANHLGQLHSMQANGFPRVP